MNSAELLADLGEKLKIAQKAGGDRVQYTLAETTLEQPVRKPVAMQPGAASVAGITDVQQALQSLSSGDTIESPADELARAVLPILEAWNRAHENRHNALLVQLKSALQTGASKDQHTTSSPDTTAESL
jgi:hypothetical protein